MSPSVVETVFSSAMASVPGTSVAVDGLPSRLIGTLCLSVGMLSVDSSLNSSSSSSYTGGTDGVDGLQG